MQTKKGVTKESAVVSTISITFEGLLMLFLNDDKPFCDVGILKAVPPKHPARILIIKKKGGISETLLDLPGDRFEERLWLDVHKKSPDIKVQKGLTFRRKSKNDADDVRWSLDFEGDEMFEEPIKVDKSGFRSILRINDGKFSTIERSKNELILLKPDEEPLTIGEVATKIGANIQLGKDDVAYFSNGVHILDPPLSAEAGVNYEIQVSQVEATKGKAKQKRPLADVDAEYYYTVVAGDLAPSRRIHFGIPARSTPDASCLTAVVGESDSGF